MQNRTVLDRDKQMLLTGIKLIYDIFSSVIKTEPSPSLPFLYNHGWSCSPTFAVRNHCNFSGKVTNLPWQRVSPCFHEPNLMKTSNTKTATTSKCTTSALWRSINHPNKKPQLYYATSSDNCTAITPQLSDNCTAITTELNYHNKPHCKR